MGDLQQASGNLLPNTENHTHENGNATRRGSGSDTGSHKIVLERSLGLFNGVALILGTIVGSGIFVSPKGVLIESGSVGAALVIWTVSGLICLLGALCFAELGVTITKSGGMYAYIQEAFGEMMGFLYLWSCLIISFPAANAVIALTFAHYILQPFFVDCQAPDSAVKLMASAAILILTFFNCFSVSLSAKVQNVFTVIKTLALAMIILTGIVVICMGHTQNFDKAFEGSSKNVPQIALAFYSGMFSYSGWYTLNFLTEELKDPYVNLPRAIFISMPLVTLIYVFANVAYFAVLTPPQIIESNAVAVTLAMKMYGVMAWIMPILVACSCFGSLNGCIMSVSRIFYVGARQGHLPKVLALICTPLKTPFPSVIFESIVSLILLLTGDVFVLINYVAFLESAAFTVCTSALLYLRWKDPKKSPPIKMNLAVPIIFLLVCIFLVIFPIFSSPKDCGFSIIFLATGIPVYIIGVMWKKKPKAIDNMMESFTIGTQKLIMGMPQDVKVD